MKIKNEKGITLMVLIITIIVMIIIAGIAIYSGIDTVKRAKVEGIKTNMMLIQAKARGYVEEASHQIGIEGTRSEEEKNAIRNKIYKEEKSLVPVSESGITLPTGIETNNSYYADKSALKKMGLEQIFDDSVHYIIHFNETDVTAEIYIAEGYENNYSLTEIEALDI